MTNIKWFLLVAMLVLGLAACSSDPSIDNNPKEQVTTPKTGENATTPDNIRKGDSGNKTHEGEVQDQAAIEQMDELSFTKFDLEVNYGPDDDYDFDYEQLSNNGNYKAELHDELHEKKLQGVEAFTALHNLTKGLDLSNNKSKEEIIQIILQTFQLDENYLSFDLEYTLKDGTKIDIKDKK